MAGPEILQPDDVGIARAVQVLQNGALLGLPTETVYGLAADARNSAAVARIFDAKGRPRFNPLIVHVADLDGVRAVADLPETAHPLVEAFWPGPLTLILPSRGAVADLVTGGLPTLAVRVPAHPVARAVLSEFDGPVAAPSANPSGRVSPTRAAHVVDGLGDRVAAILDAGPCDVGVESTIIAPGPHGIRVLREGGIAREDVEALVGPVTVDLTPGRVEAPGQMERHYATTVPLRMGHAPESGDLRIGFGAMDCDFNLSPTGNLVEAAAQLFAILHAADARAASTGAKAIWVADIPDVGLGRAINDRLRRASV